MKLQLVLAREGSRRKMLRQLRVVPTIHRKMSKAEFDNAVALLNLKWTVLPGTDHSPQFREGRDSLAQRWFRATRVNLEVC